MDFSLKGEAKSGKHEEVVQDCYSSTPLIFLFEMETTKRDPSNTHTPISHVSVSSLSFPPSFKSCLIPGRGTYEECQRRRSHMLNRSQTSVQSWHNIGQFKHPLSEFETEWHSPVITSSRLKTGTASETSGFFSIKSEWTQQLCVDRQISQYIKWINCWPLWTVTNSFILI